MAVRLNRSAYEHAQALVRDRHVVLDERAAPFEGAARDAG